MRATTDSGAAAPGQVTPTNDSAPEQGARVDRSVQGSGSTDFRAWLRALQALLRFVRRAAR